MHAYLHIPVLYVAPFRSRSKLNVPKNRYTDVLCMDHSRVLLSKRDGDANSDYINANFVDGYKHKNAYISTQGIPISDTQFC